MAQDKSVRVKRCWRGTKNSNKYEKAVWAVSFLTCLDFYSLLCTWHRTTLEFKYKSVGLSGSHTNFVGMWKQQHAFFLTDWAAAHPDPAWYVRTSYISTSTSIILPLIITPKPSWCLNLKQSVVGWSHTDARLARPAGGEPRHRFVFPRSRVVPLGFITVWSLFRGGACEAVIGSRWGGPCVPPWWCQPWWREKHGGMGVGGGGRGGADMQWARMSERRQVYRWADWQQHRCKTQPKSSHVYQTRRNNL